MPGTENLNFYLTAFISLVAIVNPFGNAPLFAVWTEGRSATEQRKTALRASLTSFIILIAFIFFGEYILKFFQITIPAFKIAGGMLIFIIGLSMINVLRPRESSTPQEEKEAGEKDDISVVPMGVPILSGPGAITTSMVLAFQVGSFEGRLVLAAVALATSVLTYIVLRESALLVKWLGHTGINILTRFMGLILTVKAAGFLIDGLLKAFPFLGAGH